MRVEEGPNPDHHEEAVEGEEETLVDLRLAVCPCTSYRVRLMIECFKCGKSGHWSNACPDPDGGGGRSKGRSGGTSSRGGGAGGGGNDGELLFRAQHELIGRML